MKNVAVLLFAMIMATAAFGQDPLTLSRQSAFQGGNYPVYSTGGFKVLVRNNTTGLLNITSYTMVNDTVNGHLLIKGNGTTGHGIDLNTSNYAAYWWAGLNRGGGKTKLQDTTGTYYIMSVSDSGQHQKYPLSVTNQVYSASNKAGLKYGLGAKGQGYILAQDSGNSTKWVQIEPLTGITSNDTLFATQAHLQVKGASGSIALSTDTAKTTINSGQLHLGASTAPMIKAGSGTPLGVVSAPIGSIYMRTDGVLDSAVYIKHTGTGNTGWWPVPHN